MFKLIRDNIPELMRVEGQLLNFAVAQNDEFYVGLLKGKLVEEVNEYLASGDSIEELVDKCPICKKRLKMFQRITGYLRCVDNYNRGKTAEFKDRNQLSSNDN